jgi:hypothetical protein
MGWRLGTQKRIAEVLNMHPGVISRDIQALAPLVDSCPACGACMPKRRAIGLALPDDERAAVRKAERGELRQKA